MIDELDRVVLQVDVPEHGLTAGDVGTAVMVHQGDKGYTVEFLTLAGQAAAVETLSAAQIRAVLPNEITHARRLASA